MSSAAQAYLNALRGLSANSNPIIVQARSNLFKNIGDEDLREILKICLDQIASRAALEGAISALLDAAVTENETIKLESSPPLDQAQALRDRLSALRICTIIPQQDTYACHAAQPKQQRPRSQLRRP
jgi:hypothetical protein